MPTNATHNNIVDNWRLDRHWFHTTRSLRMPRTHTLPTLRNCSDEQASKFSSTFYSLTSGVHELTLGSQQHRIRSWTTNLSALKHTTQNRTWLVYKIAVVYVQKYNSVLLHTRYCGIETWQKTPSFLIKDWYIRVFSHLALWFSSRANHEGKSTYCICIVSGSEQL